MTIVQIGVVHYHTTGNNNPKMGTQNAKHDDWRSSVPFISKLIYHSLCSALVPLVQMTLQQYDPAGGREV